MRAQIYPADANTIVSLLDINLPRPGEDPAADAAPPFEILEAGTGHGALTMHLARAIHGANPAVPASLRAALAAAEYVTPKEPKTLWDSAAAAAAATPSQGALPDPSTTASPPTTPEPHSLVLPDTATAAAYQAYLASSRRAMIHTLDINSGHSRLAHANVKNFRRAMYLPDITFHVGRVPAYLRRRLAAAQAAPSPIPAAPGETGGGDDLAQTASLSRREPFLAHAVLDLPSPFHPPTLALLAASLRTNGTLLVFCPSVSQLADAAELLFNATAPLSAARDARGRARRETLLPFRQERVVQLPRGTLDMAAHAEGLAGTAAGAGGMDWAVEAEEVADYDRPLPDGSPVVRVVTRCRPAVGVMHFTGGAFVGVYRKLVPTERQLAHMDELIRRGEVEEAARAERAALAREAENDKRDARQKRRKEDSASW